MLAPTPADNTGATGTAGDVCGSTSSNFGDGHIWFSFVADTTTAYLDLLSELCTGRSSVYISSYDGCGGNCVYDNSIVTEDARGGSLKPVFLMKST